MKTPPQPTPQTDGKAIGSLVLGILSLACFSILAGIPAIVLGHISRSAIEKSMGQLKGKGMALAGLILGYISVALIPVMLILATIAIPSLLRSRQLANESSAVANLRTINFAEETSRASGANYRDLQALVTARLVDDSFLDAKAGYRYSVTASETEYTARATPSSPNGGRYEYVSSQDGAIRYSTNPLMAPPGRAGQQRQ